MLRTCWYTYHQDSLPSSATWGTNPYCFPGLQHKRSGFPRMKWFGSLERVLRWQKILANCHHRVALDYRPGERVWISTKDLNFGPPLRELFLRFICPSKITRRINPVTYGLHLPLQLRISLSFHVSFLRPVIPRSLQDIAPCNTPPPALTVDGEPAYVVRAFLDSQRRGGQLQYLVDWDGYGQEECSWVAPEDVLDPFLKAEFHWRPRCPRPRARSHLTRRVPVTFRAAPQEGAFVTCPAQPASQPPPTAQTILLAVWTHCPPRQNTNTCPHFLFITRSIKDSRTHQFLV